VASLLLQAQNKNWARSSARTAVVLGGGVSGLATAWFLKKLRGDLVNVVVSCILAAEPAGPEGD
jgi:glycine/D-amino acid oxidase-like deaminating enzyme